VVICLERGADLHMAQLMALPLAVSCSSKIQIGFTFLVLAQLGSPGKGPLCVCRYGPQLSMYGSKFTTLIFCMTNRMPTTNPQHAVRQTERTQQLFALY